MVINENDLLFASSVLEEVSETEETEDYISINDFTGSCPHCNSKLIWGNDFDGEDLSSDLIETIISFWFCSHCNKIFGFIHDISE